MKGLISKLNRMIYIFKKLWWPISLMMLVIVTIASLAPLPVLPEVPGTDKTHHIIAYALVVIPISFVKPRFFFLILIGVVAWSGVIELVQPFVNRYGEWSDLLANAVGVCLGCVFGFLLKKVVE